MLKSKSFICGDLGAGTLKLAEFEPNESGGLRLLRYAHRSLGLDGSKDSARHDVLLAAMQETLEAYGFESRAINVCAAGFHVFSKFVKLPAVDTAKVSQIIQYEAQQNVPFPLDEVVWDYQIMGTTSSGELEVLLVAIKQEIVEGLFSLAKEAGLEVQLVDVSAAALCNTFRFNYGDEEGCTMLLDIGAKTSNLVFFEGEQVFARSINIGANAITQDFASEMGLTFDEAEQAKIEVGFVSLGGAYEEPDDPNAAAVSKIARQVMTRLHIQMNQTIQFYRGQQGGTTPLRLYLAGGASVMAYASQFFAEKLNIPVDYLNPFVNIELDEELDLEGLSAVAHTMGEVVGLGIRNLAQCPVNLNLMPKSHQTRMAFKQKQPYFISAIVSLVLVVFAYGLFYDRVRAAKASQLATIKQVLDPLRGKKQQLDAAVKQKDGNLKQAEEQFATLESRVYWGKIFMGLRDLLIKFEEENSLEGSDAGVWIESFIPQYSQSEKKTAAPKPQQQVRFANQMGAAAKQAQSYAGPSTVHYVETTFRAINLIDRAPDANVRFTDGLHKAIIANTEYFIGNGTQMLGITPAEEGDLTYTFKIRIRLANPVTVY